MPDDPNDSEQKPATQGPDTKPETVTPEELQTLQEKAARLDKMDTIAQDMMGTDSEEYLQSIEQELYTAQEKEKTRAKPAVKPASPGVDPRIEELDSRTQMTAENTVKAQIDAQFATYRVHQMGLPEEDRSSLTKDELLTVLKGHGGPIVKEMVLRDTDGQFEGNLFLGAAHYKTTMDGTKAAREAGAKSEAALNAAKETANLPTGGIPVPATGSEEEQLDEYVATMSPPDPKVE